MLQVIWLSRIVHFVCFILIELWKEEGLSQSMGGDGGDRGLHAVTYFIILSMVNRKRRATATAAATATATAAATAAKRCYTFVPFGLVAEIWITFYTCLSATWPTKRDMSAQGLLSSVFSCSLSPKTISKRKLRQTRSLDPALMRYYGTEAEETSSKVSDLTVSKGGWLCSLPETELITFRKHVLLKLTGRDWRRRPDSGHSDENFRYCWRWIILLMTM